MSTDKLEITAVDARDFKRLSEVRVETGGHRNLLLIAGKNTAGKSSLMDALTVALGGKDALPCEVYDDLTDSAMAGIFLGRDARRAISAYDKFHVSCTAGRPRENDIRRVVEANGLKIGRHKEENTIGAIGALGKVYDRCGDVVVGQVVRAIKQAFAGDPSAFAPELIEGVGLVFNRYNGKTNEKELAARLAATPHGVRGLLRRVESQRERTGNQKSQCVAATVVDIYNKPLGQRSSERLPDWWKSAQ